VTRRSSLASRRTRARSCSSWWTALWLTIRPSAGATPARCAARCSRCSTSIARGTHLRDLVRTGAPPRSRSSWLGSLRAAQDAPASVARVVGSFAPGDGGRGLRSPTPSASAALGNPDCSATLDESGDAADTRRRHVRSAPSALRTARAANCGGAKRRCASSNWHFA